jgi:hypothetical protein
VATDQLALALTEFGEHFARLARDATTVAAMARDFERAS